MDTTLSRKGIVLTIHKDKMRADIHINNPSLSKKEILAIIKELLNSQQIRFGFQAENLKRALQTPVTTTPFVIAQGRAPKIGQPPRIEKLINFHSTKKVFQKSDHDRVNYKEIIRFNIVEKGTPLVRIIPSQPGKPGKNIFGEEIPPPPIPDKIPVRLGKNVAFDKNDPHLIVACEAGLATFSETGKVDVFTTFKVDGNVDLDTGNIRFPGKVIINGDVKSGFVVEARGDVIIHGSVEDALVESDRDIIIYRGFSGGGKGRLQAGRDIQVAFARNGKLFAKRDILFEVELITSQCRADRTIKSSDGRIVGGKTEAMESIQIRSAGSEEEVRTILIVGQKESLNDERNTWQEKVRQYKAEFEENKKIIYELVVKKLDNRISEEELNQLDEYQQLQEELKEKLTQAETQLAEIMQKYEKLKKVFVRINGIVYPNVEVHIGESTWLSKEKTHYISLHEKDDRIRIIRI